MEQPRLTEVMRSRKAMALDFITSYIETHNGVAPVQSEIATAIGTNKERVKAIIRTLEREGRLHRVPGVTRGLALPSTVERAKQQLRAAGWKVDDDVHAISPAQPVVTFSTLPMIARARQTAEGGHGSGGDGSVGG